MENMAKEIEMLLELENEKLSYVSLKNLCEKYDVELESLPHTIKILIENIARRVDGKDVKLTDVEALVKWGSGYDKNAALAFMPARVLMQDFTGVPAVVDLAAMRSAMARSGGDPKKVNPYVGVDLVIDHSVQVDNFGNAQAYEKNLELEYERNAERYALLNWAQQAFQDFRVVPPGMGICHQVNLEHLGHVVQSKKGWAIPDTLVGTDSHTPMINGLGVLGWGVGGIEAEAAMLGQPMFLPEPIVIGVRTKGTLPAGATATDLVLTLTEMLRSHGVVGKFVEFFGDGLSNLSIADRATLSNMSPEFGATATLFPVDQATLDYLVMTGRGEKVELVEKYTKEQGLFRRDGDKEPQFSEVLDLDLSRVVPSLAGPKLPQQRVGLGSARKSFDDNFKVEKNDGKVIKHGDVAIAAITSCTNTSNPSVMLAAGLVAKKAVEAGLKTKPWVKTSLAPGSRVVTNYLKKAGLLPYLEELGFNLVGYGCTTCIGNSGPLPEDVAKDINDNNLAVVSVLSGNRNFEGRVHSQIKASYLASPPLCVAYALTGTFLCDLSSEAIGQNANGKDIYLKDIWPSASEVQELISSSVSSEQYEYEYGRIFAGDEKWKSMAVPKGDLFEWQDDSTYVREPDFFVNLPEKVAPLENINDARVMCLLGDSITTDHISPAGTIGKDSPAGKYLIEQGVSQKDFNSFGSRRGNHEVMIRGTFGNIRLRNEMAPGTEGPWTTHLPSREQMSIYDASKRYETEKVPLVVVAGSAYGSGSSRDWAAKGTTLLGIKAVLAESYERIHRSNLVCMGVLPLQFKEGQNARTLKITGLETFSIEGIAEGITPRKELLIKMKREDGSIEKFEVILRVDAQAEVDYYTHGGILQMVLREMQNR
ncbi:aconitate hydratase 1 [Bacteriovorax sp. BAL6_X]|uniref:aconitate hydratase AcnA n=1 Tax=Bacteriovorax sp. BAL6_X TaxID=1201290 RepID=UPI000385B479|nr:aconitate hydratase AcnA [Bacteriovorax sp. BAL6_X]EPZ50045.1 aconitate hydratase 1 [Bacteriovorax sp. BAL6_X]